MFLCVCHFAWLGVEKLLAEPLENPRLYVERCIWISISCSLHRPTIKALALKCTWKSLSCLHMLPPPPFALAAIILTSLFIVGVLLSEYPKQSVCRVSFVLFCQVIKDVGL